MVCPHQAAAATTATATTAAPATTAATKTAAPATTAASAKPTKATATKTTKAPACALLRLDHCLFVRGLTSLVWPWKLDDPLFLLRPGGRGRAVSPRTSFLPCCARAWFVLRPRRPKHLRRPPRARRASQPRRRPRLRRGRRRPSSKPRQQRRHGRGTPRGRRRSDSSRTSPRWASHGTRRAPAVSATAETWRASTAPRRTCQWAEGSRVAPSPLLRGAESGSAARGRFASHGAPVD